MPKLPVLSAREIIAALECAGFEPDRHAGSHMILVHRERRRTVAVPMHGGRDVPAGTLICILRQAGLSAEDLRGWL